MPISEERHNLFHSSGIADKLSLFQSLLDSKDLDADEALALLNNIHAELEQPRGQSSSVYVRYAEVMESLQRQMPEVHQEVAARWQESHSKLQAKGSGGGSVDEAPGGEPIREEESTAEKHSDEKEQAESAAE